MNLTKLKINEKVTSLEELKEAEKELSLVIGYDNFNNLYSWTKQYLCRDERRSNENWIAFREGYRVALYKYERYLPGVDRSTLKSFHHLFKLQAYQDLSEALKINDFRFMLPAEMIGSNYANGRYRLYKYRVTEGVLSARSEYRICADKHHIRVSNTDPKMLSCFLNEKMAQQDRRTRLKFGRLLSKVLNYTDNEDIKRLNTFYNELTSPVVVRLAHSAEEIIKIYESGPNSCMMDKGWSPEKHPVQLYDHPHLCVAYLDRLGYRDGASARAVIRTDGDNPEYIRVYGNADKMILALEKLNIHQSLKGFDGLTFDAIKNDRTYDYIVMPYLDGNATTVVPIENDKSKVKIISSNDAKDLSLPYKKADKTCGYIQHPGYVSCTYGSSDIMVWYKDLIPIKTRHGIIRVSLNAFIDRLDSFIEVHRWNAPSEIWLFSRTNPFIIELNGEFYHLNEVGEWGYVAINGEWLHISNPSIARCPVSHKIGLKESMVEIESKFYFILPDEKDICLDMKTATIHTYPPKNNNSLLSIEFLRSTLKQIYGLPIYKSEIACEIPNLPDNLKLVLYNTVNSFDSVRTQ